MASYDLVITGGTVVDGTGLPRRRADVGILDGRIAAIGFIEPGFFKTAIVDNANIPDPTGSPYESIARATETFYRTSVENGADPKAVIDAFLAAADGTLPADTIHHLVGDDAQLFVGGMEQMSYADYQAMGREMIGI